MQSILSDFTAAIASRMSLVGARILDVGCGDGAFVRELARAGARVTGVECSEAQLALCRQAPPVGGEQYLYGVGQSLPFDTGVFDATLFRASLHHVPAREMEQALREARRVTRPTGELYVFEPLTSGTHFELTRLVDDETTVRAQAQAAIARAVAAGWLSSPSRTDLGCRCRLRERGRAATADRCHRRIEDRNLRGCRTRGAPGVRVVRRRVRGWPAVHTAIPARRICVSEASDDQIRPDPVLRRPPSRVRLGRSRRHRISRPLRN